MNKLHFSSESVEAIDHLWLINTLIATIPLLKIYLVQLTQTTNQFDLKFQLNLIEVNDEYAV